ncbi:hypothetical protein Tcan_10256 [Toxocara canis]|uniref:Uncharacterized protein n=1 Tax=Toxocara canis TaxID=6265 RepID=A0A0B2UN24_TOXCA|nr:hypothetical protein Tcan_10256 [Toxocara canis]
MKKVWDRSDNTSKAARSLTKEYHTQHIHLSSRVYATNPSTPTTSVIIFDYVSHLPRWNCSIKQISAPLLQQREMDIGENCNDSEWHVIISLNTINENMDPNSSSTLLQ